MTLLPFIVHVFVELSIVPVLMLCSPESGFCICVFDSFHNRKTAAICIVVCVCVANMYVWTQLYVRGHTSCSCHTDYSPKLNNLMNAACCTRFNAHDTAHGHRLR